MKTALLMSRGEARSHLTSVRSGSQTIALQTQTIADLTNELEIAKQRPLPEQVEQLQEMCNQKKEHIKQLQEELLQTKADLEDATDGTRSRAEECAMLTAKLTATQLSLQMANVEVDALQRSLNAEKTQLQLATKELEGAHISLDKAEERHILELEGLQNQIAHRNRQVNSLEDQVAAAQQQYADEHFKSQQLHTSLSLSQDLVLQTQKGQKQLQQQLEDTKAQLAQEQMDRDKQQAADAQAQGMIESLEKKLAASVTSLELAQSELKTAVFSALYIYGSDCGCDADGETRT